MQPIFLLGLCLGALLGMRFKVLVLAPALISANGLVLAVGLSAGTGLGRILLIGLTVTVALQVGYFCGVMLRLAELMVRSARVRNYGATATPVANQ